MTEMSRDEVLAKAREAFGEGVEVSHTSGKWYVMFEAEEKFDASEWSGTPAYQYFEVEKNSIEDWADGYGCFWESHAQIFDNYNEWYVGQMRANLKLVRKMDESGISPNWENGEEWRRKILDWAKENGE